MLKVKLIKSLITQPAAQRKVVAALGLRRLHQVRELPDNPCTWGMIRKVQHLVEVVR
ncbi:MAG: ribosomal protein [Desulfomicrobiaceae bacterium]|jgi:large subunit ribosomal protein L30|nr:50S ribosomal protein L30 [Desulfomicrobiaceae bacterium]MBZ4648083.1 ribosomal protein [Desulfomicrobiaceae bacterium]MBZ4686181.1 ribosomal protein [Desulfomicrobiaceae bacterium]MDI3493233.1 large subunit ribosomal protein [Desulfomicrobiaceae bacterium]MDK2873517.1 large subunit ribosomal protein [Desulfomicrobiaceae bacterium]